MIPPSTTYAHGQNDASGQASQFPAECFRDGYQSCREEDRHKERLLEENDSVRGFLSIKLPVVVYNSGKQSHELLKNDST